MGAEPAPLAPRRARPPRPKRELPPLNPALRPPKNATPAQMREWRSLILASAHKLVLPNTPLEDPRAFGTPVPPEERVHPRLFDALAPVVRAQRNIVARHTLHKAKKAAGFKLVANAPPLNVTARHAGYCYLRLFPLRARYAAAHTLHANPTCAAIRLLLQSVFAGIECPHFTLSLVFTLDPLHVEFGPAKSDSLVLAAHVLSSFPDKILGAPRAAFSGALELLGGTIHKDAVLDAYTAPAASAIATSRSLCPNQIAEPNFSLLSNAGYPVDPNAVGSHPHPALKAIEEGILSDLAFAMNDACTVMFMKSQKFSRLQARSSLFPTLINPVLSVRDTTRFAPAFSSHVAPVTTPSLFLHDVGHYITPVDVHQLFLENPRVQRLFFSAILPDEMLFQEPSWHPTLYRLQGLSRTHYAYTLAESDDVYEQPYHSLAWLRTNRIVVGSAHTHGVEIVAQRFSHKLFCVTRSVPDSGDFAPRSWHIPSAPDDVLLPDVDGRILDHRAKRVPRVVFQAVLSHSLGLATQRFESTMSKVRTFISNPAYSHIDMGTWMALAQVCYALSLEPARLAREAPVNSYAALFLRTSRRFFHRHDNLLPILTGASLAVSWGSLIYPMLGLPSPSLHLPAGLRVPGWSVGATAAAAAQVLLAVAGGSLPSAPLWLLRVLSLVLPHLAYLYPSFTLGPVTIPSAVFGVVGSVVATAVVAAFDGTGPHYEVRDFIARMPGRSERRVALGPSYVLLSGNSKLWTHGVPPVAPSDGGPPEPPPPPYTEDSSAASVLLPDEISEASSVRELEVFGGCASRLLTFTTFKAVDFELGSDPDEESLIDLDELSVSPRSASPVPIDPAPSSPSVNSLPASPTLHPLRERFGLRRNEVFEDDMWSLCPSDASTPGLPLPRNCCLLQAFSELCDLSVEQLWLEICLLLPPSELSGHDVESVGLSALVASALAYRYRIRVDLLGVIPAGHPLSLGLVDTRTSLLSVSTIRLYYTPGHWSARLPTRLAGSASSAAPAVPSLPHRPLSRFEKTLASTLDFTGVPAISPWQCYVTRPQRAKPYVRDLKSGYTGTLLSAEGKHRVPVDFTASLDAMVDLAKPRKVLFSAVLGAPGSSKSSGIRSALNIPWTRSANHWKMAVPRVKLRTEWSTALSLGALSWKVGTFETSMFKTGTTLIVDEISQFPPGYIDACLVKDSTIQSVLVIGDVTQGSFFEPNPDSTMDVGFGEAAYFSRFCHQYRLYSNSIPRAVSSAIGLPTRSVVSGFVRVAERVNLSWPIVCASDAEVKLYSSQGCDAYTFGTVQGQRWPSPGHPSVPIQIAVSNATAGLVSRGHFVSAMCRSNVGVVFVLTGTAQVLRALQSDVFLYGIFSGGRRLLYEDLFPDELRHQLLFTPPGLFDPLSLNEHAAFSFPAVPNVRATLFRGKGLQELPFSRASDPLQALLTSPAGVLPEHVTPSTAFEPGPPTSAFLEDESYILASFGSPPVREEREEYDLLSQSCQFNDSPWTLRHAPSNELEQLFPRHRADDLLTFRRTVEKRLRYATPSLNLARYASRSFLGPLLFDAWCRVTGVDDSLIPPFDADLYASCIYENEFAKLTKKSQATLLNNADRADADWRGTFVRIFLKSQLKVKLETLLSPFKAGQTIASFHDSVILVTGPMARYLTVVSERLFRPSYYYHPGHSPLALSAWCQREWKPVPLNSTNDYTAYDQSQTGEALSLEVTKCRAFGIPTHVIAYYVDLKCHLSCQFGDLAVMRFTGEGPTLLFNSDFNAALIGLQYALPPLTPVAVAGDDMAINGSFPERHGWREVSKHLTIVAKPERVRVASFCSWLLTPAGAIKEPRVVFAKLLIARERREERLVLPNLMMEVAVGYHIGDHVYEWLDGDTLAAHFFLIRYFVTHAPLRFRLLLATRSVDAVLSRLRAMLDVSRRAMLDDVMHSAASLWMLQSRPLRIVSSLLSQGGYNSLRLSSVFDNLLHRLSNN